MRFALGQEAQALLRPRASFALGGHVRGIALDLVRRSGGSEGVVTPATLRLLRAERHDDQRSRNQRGKSRSSHSVNLTAESNSNNGFAAFSPDGTRLVFRSSRSGNFDIYTMNVNGSDVRQLTNDPAKDNFPAFSPDGQSIVFTSDRDGIVDHA